MKQGFRFRNRKDAGERLAADLKHYANAANGIVLALPRGGVPVAAEVSAALHLPLDVYLVRKLGLPGNQELAIGAIAADQSCIFNDDIVLASGIEQALIDRAIAREREELQRRERLYRQGLAPLHLAGQIVIVVDDGLATGATMIAAISAIRRLGPQKIIVAVPVGSTEACDKITPLVDQLVCLYRPTPLWEIGRWYEDFSQTEDNEVLAILHRHRD